MLGLLNDLHLTVVKGKSTRDVPLKVEVIKLNERGGEYKKEGSDDNTEPTESKTDNRIETTDVTSV